MEAGGWSTYHPTSVELVINFHATAAANDVGVDVETFRLYMKAQLCVESTWRGYRAYCTPTVGLNKDSVGNIVSVDWNIAQINDIAFKRDKRLLDPRGGVLFGPIDDKRQEYDPFYGIRFQAKLLSRFLLLMRRRQFNGLSLTQKFQNAMVMYNGGETRFFYSTDPGAPELAWRNDNLDWLIENNPKLVERLTRYLNAVENRIVRPCQQF
jgi:hypothetical protein